MKRVAVFDEKYRYSLTREWDESKGRVVFIMLNPSIANNIQDDSTTKRCIKFARKFGYGSLEIVNLFGYVTPYPSELKKLDKKEAIGSENNAYIIRALNSAENVIAAWGENGTIYQRHEEVEKLIDGYDIDCLGALTRDGQPRHPLYISNAVELFPYKRPKKKIVNLHRTTFCPDNQKGPGKGIIIKDGVEINCDSRTWCELCHENFTLNGIQLCNTCFEHRMEDFKEFIIQKYRLSEKSAKDYVHRFKGMIKRELYKGNKELTPFLKATIEKEFPNSKNHYVLTVERYIEFQNKLEK